MKFSAATGDDWVNSSMTMSPRAVEMVAVVPSLAGSTGGWARGVASGGPGGRADVGAEADAPGGGTEVLGAEADVLAGGGDVPGGGAGVPAVAVAVGAVGGGAVPDEPGDEEQAPANRITNRAAAG